MSKTAFITGVSGQDGWHLATLLLGKGYRVCGLVRGQMERGHPRYREIEAQLPGVELVLGDLLDGACIARAITRIQPDEVYNLAAISHVGYSFENPGLTTQVTAMGVLNVLEGIRGAGLVDRTRFYQASTSEMFGGLDYNRPSHGYDEHALFHPRSPYGVAKLYGHWLTCNYRETYGMHANSGILFNHEGERRGPEFVTRKITQAAARAAVGRDPGLRLGNLDAKRDWGYAGDYVEGMWRMLQQEQPGDFVLGTGEAHTVREFCELAFSEVGMKLVWDGVGPNETGVDSETGSTLVRVDAQLFRPAEVDILLANPAKAEQVLGWRRQVDFRGLVSLMVRHDLAAEEARFPAGSDT